MSNALAPHCAAFIAMSLDGFIAGPDGSLDWLAAVEREGEDYGYNAFFTEIDTVVLGRKTWETVIGFESWPYAGRRVAVLSSQPREGRHGERFFNAAPGELLDTLAAEGAQRVYVDGGAAIRSFLRAGRLDTMTVSVIPVLLGSGVPLFGDGVARPLTLRATRAYDSGVVQLTWAVTR